MPAMSSGSKGRLGTSSSQAAGVPADTPITAAARTRRQSFINTSIAALWSRSLLFEKVSNLHRTLTLFKFLLKIDLHRSAKIASKVDIDLAIGQIEDCRIGRKRLGCRLEKRATNVQGNVFI